MNRDSWFPLEMRRLASSPSFVPELTYLGWMLNSFGHDQQKKNKNIDSERAEVATVGGGGEDDFLLFL